MAAASLLVIVFGVFVSPVHAAEGEAASESWAPVIWKFINFAILVGGLGYLLRNLVPTYLRTRGQTIRKDLADAAALRAQADARLADVRAKLAAIPAELAALRRMGQEELAGERARMKAATDQERQRLVDRTQRDIDLQFRQARRALLEHTAELAMARARTRIAHDITADDQARLIDRYTAQVRP